MPRTDASLILDAPLGPSAVRLTLAGFCATFVGIGVSRFGYSPLIPALISEHWFEPGEAAYIGAANLVGYLLGAVLAGALGSRLPLRWILRLSMTLAALSLFACAQPAAFGWFFFWRGLAGMVGGVLTVLAPPAVLAQVPVHRQGAVGGIVFGGVGLGIAASGTLVPLLMRLGLTETWLGLGLLASAATAVAWNGWPQTRRSPVAAPEAVRPVRNLRLWLAVVCYGLNGLGLVPPMIFLVDMVARGRGLGLDAGSAVWVVFGLGALVGPLICGRIADKIGFDTALPVAFVIQAVVIVGFVAPVPVWVIFVCAAIIGAFVPGIVPLVLGRVRDVLPGDPRRQAAAWSACTAALALGTAGGGYLMSFMFARGWGGYPTLFLMGAAAVVLSLALDLLGLALGGRRAHPRR
ncbi:YbfB/YjiJ family MFS transporter [Azorhizobium sp. AG788]|uniref:YbfB/YjiJ family MFS transporter n=1 Tax=Azorhizobium sp. AG788 TaxID=2183897 RepID=UPI0031394AF0